MTTSLPRHILVPHDFSETAQTALSYAMELAAKLQARLTVLHAYELPSYGYPEGLAMTPEVVENIQRSSELGLEAVVAKARQSGIAVAQVLRQGPAWSEIDAVAKESRVDLIVMGTHGRQGISRALLGSIAEKVVRTAPCPVLDGARPSSRTLTRVSASPPANPAHRPSEPSRPSLSGAAGFPIASALRRTRAFRKGYGLNDLRADVLAGIVVGIVALPLSMALAIAVGAPPQHGLYTAIVAGFSVSLLGGCKFQVSGPTAAFVVILAPIVAKHGLDGLLTAGFMAVHPSGDDGRAAARHADQVHPVPGHHRLHHRDCDGHRHAPDQRRLRALHRQDARLLFRETRGTLGRSLSVGELAGGPDSHRDPGAAAGDPARHEADPRTTHRHRFCRRCRRAHPPHCPVFPRRYHRQPFPHDRPRCRLRRDSSRSPRTVPALGPLALVLAHPRPLPGGFRHRDPGRHRVAALRRHRRWAHGHEARSQRRARGSRHRQSPRADLRRHRGDRRPGADRDQHPLRCPLAHRVCDALDRGAPGTSSPRPARLVRTHGFAGGAAPARRVEHVRGEEHFAGLLKLAPRGDVSVLLTCFFLTVFFDMVVAVSIGFMLAAILFMHRMAAITEAKLAMDNTEEHRLVELPMGVSFYEVNGPLFFGAAQRAMEALHASHTDSFHTLVLHLGKVSVIDATGFAALENAIELLVSRKKVVIIAGPLPQPQKIFAKARLESKHSGMVRVAADLRSALKLARDMGPLRLA